MLWSVCFVLIHFVSAADCSTECKIEEMVSSRTITNLTRSWHLNCSVEHGKIASMITWKWQGEVLRQAGGPIKWLGLSFDKTAVKRADVRCEVLVGQQNKTCRLPHEEPPRISSRKQVYEAYGGTSLFIPCRATGSPEPRLTWIKRDQSLAIQNLPQSIKQIKSRASLTLMIKRVTQIHGGIYMCHAVNPLGKDTHIVLILVTYRTLPYYPLIVSNEHVVTVEKGSTATLVCSAKNAPRRYTAVFWDHYGTRVKNTARHHIKSRFSKKIIKEKYNDESVDTSLTITHVSAKDVGPYTCGVVTHVGRDEDRVTLRIRLF